MAFRTVNYATTTICGKARLEGPKSVSAGNGKAEYSLDRWISYAFAQRPIAYYLTAMALFPMAFQLPPRSRRNGFVPRRHLVAAVALFGAMALFREEARSLPGGFVRRNGFVRRDASFPAVPPGCTW